MGFFFFSLGGNGSFLSIKDAVTCLQHHVGCNFIRTRNFCQLIFPCPGCRALCRVCLRLAALSCAIPWVWGWQQSLQLAGITRMYPQIALSCCCLLAFAEGSLEGELCLQTQSPVPWERGVFPGFSGDISSCAHSSNSSCTDPPGIPNVGGIVLSLKCRRECQGLSSGKELTAAACGGWRQKLPCH